MGDSKTIHSGADSSVRRAGARIGAIIGAHRIALGVVAGLIGAVVGVAAVLFNLMIAAWSTLSTGFEEYTQHLGDNHGFFGWPAWVFLLLAPSLSALIYGPLVHRFAPSARGHGIPEVMLAVKRKGGKIPERVAVVKLIASSLTIGSGGSAGREGPIVQVGTSIGSAVSSFLRLPTSRTVLLVSCGAAGGIAATFHAPMAAAVFALEVILVQFSAEAFGYVVIAAVMSSVVARALQGDEVVVDVGTDLAFSSLTDIVWVAILGLIAGLAGLGFSKMLYSVEDVIDALWGKLHLPEWSRPAVLAVLLGAGLIAFPHMFGSGNPIEEAALAGEYSIGFLLVLMLGRILFTSYTIGMGGSGGVFAPTLFVGAMVGAAFGQLIDPASATSAGVYGVIGMGAAFAGAARAPMTAVLIIVEMTGQFSLIMPMMLAVVIAMGASRFLTRGTIYTEKLRRRGDVLDDPVDGTLLGNKPVREWMGPVPHVLRVSESLSQAVRILRSTREECLPVIDEGDRFVGLVSALDVAAARGEDASLDAELSEAILSAERLGPDDLPSVALEALRASGYSALPVVDKSERLIGWVGQRDLVDRMYRDQRRALDARRQTSFGSRWQDKHRRP
ncbi:chloride channel protein [Schaalia vaccimaxillae]|uniref:chloride channel protein n=1 Tax=Schaalia vaccimaxillae TaxID=183916 RepID=UPI00042741C5|nr:chloride channel protein [Schaalia vaccimaxillae]